MDYNTGLTQALSDGTNTYIYGLDRIAQTHASIADYFLTDALGSVRQLTDPTGAITFARTYDPYGVTTQTTGAAQTAYGYTGEFTTNNLVYLRARQYAPNMGRFLTRDTWGGDANSPMSFNRWNYTSSNPINRVDPSGHCYNPDGSWNWFQWPLFGLGPCSSNTSGATTTITPTLQAIVTATATCTPIPDGTITPALVFLWINNSKWHVPEPSNNRLYKHVDFWFTVTGDDPHHYALVQFRKGYSKSLTPGVTIVTQVLGQENVNASSPNNWIIDSTDRDPVYQSDPVLGRWNYKKESNTTYSTYDQPNVPINSDISDNFKMCIFKLVDVPIDGLSANVNDLMSVRAIKCVDWTFQAIYREDGGWVVPEYQLNDSSSSFHP